MMTARRVPPLVGPFFLPRPSSDRGSSQVELTHVGKAARARLAAGRSLIRARSHDVPELPRAKERSR